MDKGGAGNSGFRLSCKFFRDWVGKGALNRPYWVEMADWGAEKAGIFF